MNRPGHAIKTRSPDNLIEGNYITGGKGKTGRLIELPSGGRVVIKNNTIVQNSLAENQDLIAAGYERKGSNPGRQVYMIINNNEVECNKPKDGCDLLAGQWREGDVIELGENVLKGNFRPLNIPSSVVNAQQ